MAEGRVLMNEEDEHAGSQGRQYVMIEGTDSKVHLIYYSPEMEQVRGRGGMRANSLVRLRKLFSAGKPLIEIEDLGNSEAILKNKQHLRSAAQALVRRGIIPYRGRLEWLVGSVSVCSCRRTPFDGPGPEPL